MTTVARLDDLDKALLEELNVDARRSHRDLARRLKVAPTTVGQRIARLERDGVIRGYVPLLDDEQLGWDLAATIGIRISKGKLREVEERLAPDPRPDAVYDVNRDLDAPLHRRVPGPRDLRPLL